MLAIEIICNFNNATKKIINSILMEFNENIKTKMHIILNS